jgi:hypothetical protein
MTAAVINPSAFPVVFPASQGWHKDGRDVTIYAIQLFSAYHLLSLAVKGMTFRPVSSPVRFLNQTFGRKLERRPVAGDADPSGGRGPGID